MTFLANGLPRAFTESVEFVIQEELRGGQSRQANSGRGFQWPEEVGKILLRLVDSTETQIAAWSSCLEWGLVSFPETFEQYILDQIHELRWQFPFNHKDKLVQACCILFKYGRKDPWDQLSEIFYERP